MNLLTFRRLFLILSLTCLILYVMSSVSAGSVVRGKVLKQTSFGLFPAAKVKITCQGAGSGLSTTYTDSEGWYYFYNLLPGKYTVAVQGTTPLIQEAITVPLNVPVPTMVIH